MSSPADDAGTSVTHSAADSVVTDPQVSQQQAALQHSLCADRVAYRVSPCALWALCELSALHARWAAEQQAMRARLETSDRLGFACPQATGSSSSNSSSSSSGVSPAAPFDDDSKCDSEARPSLLSSVASAAASSSSACASPPLTLVGGVDISFVEGSDDACAALVVCAYPPIAPSAQGHPRSQAAAMTIVYESMRMVRLTAPYVPGFLAFREVPHLLALIEEVRAKAPQLTPQLILVDGNGMLHPRGFGLACQLGVLADIPTIGIGKNLHMVDGLERDAVDAEAARTLQRGGQSFPLVGHSGTTWGACMRSTDSARNPIFVSIGHRVCLDSAVRLTALCCRHRVPEPVRLADLRSREFIRQWKGKQQAAAAAAAAAAAGDGAGTAAAAAASAAPVAGAAAPSSAASSSSSPSPSPCAASAAPASASPSASPRSAAERKSDAESDRPPDMAGGPEADSGQQMRSHPGTQQQQQQQGPGARAHAPSHDGSARPRQTFVPAERAAACVLT